MTSVAMKTRGGEKPGPDVTAVLRPRRVNLGLTCPSHTRHTRTDKHTHTEFKCSTDLRWQHFHINLYLFTFSCQQKHWHHLRRAPLGWVHLHKLVYRCVHIQPSQKQGYKHNQMPLWFHTEVYSHTWKHTWGSHGSSELTNPFTREPMHSGGLPSAFSAICFHFSYIWMF